MLGSFTKSYIMDRVVTAAMRVPGIHSVVLNLGATSVRGASQSLSTSSIREMMRTAPISHRRS